MREIFCIKYQKKMPGMAQPPLPGEQGKYIYDNVSQQAWQDWLEHQTRLINEYQLSLADPKTRTYLTEQMDNFFHNREFDKAAGYVPEDKDK